MTIPDSYTWTRMKSYEKREWIQRWKQLSPSQQRCLKNSIDESHQENQAWWRVILDFISFILSALTIIGGAIVLYLIVK